MGLGGELGGRTRAVSVDALSVFSHVGVAVASCNQAHAKDLHTHAVDAHPAVLRAGTTQAAFEAQAVQEVARNEGDLMSTAPIDEQAYAYCILGQHYK